MGTKLLPIAAVAAVLIAALLLAGLFPEVLGGNGPRRGIVSMSPSTTEMLFALGLGDRVVGATEFCNYPPEAKQVPRVGGYNDPNIEAIVAMRPEWIVMLQEHRSTAPTLEKLDCRKVYVSDDSIEDILTAIETLGEKFDARAEAGRIVGRLRDRMERVNQATAGLKRTRVMVVVDRTPGHIRSVYVAGSDPLTNQILRLAGGENVFAETKVRFPIVSMEGILGAEPDVILDLSVRTAGSPEEANRAVADWQQFADELHAVREGRVFAVADDYATIPGPRFILLAEKLARLLHPEIDSG